MNNNENVSSDILRFAEALKQNILKDSNVADLGIVLTVGDVYTIRIISDSSVIRAYALDEKTYLSGDVVCVLFTNYDFSQNLTKMKNLSSPQNATNTTKHPKSPAIIVGKLM